MSMINTIITTYETKTNYLSMSCLSMSFHSDQFSVDSVCTEPIPFIVPHLPAVVLLKNTMFSLSYATLCHNLYSFGDLFIYILCICKDVGGNGEAFLFFVFVCLFVCLGFFFAHWKVGKMPCRVQAQLQVSANRKLEHTLL